ncbi:MAG: hypothetical protein U0638_01875 [Phycisphaerales bacterium]
MSKQILKAWGVLSSIAAAREQSKTREKDLIQERKGLDGKLNDLGAGNTAEHLRVSREYVVCIRAIEYERNRQKTLADDAERIVRDGNQGKFDFADEVDVTALAARPTEEEMFRAPEPDDAQPTLNGDTRPVGRPGLKPKPEEPDPSKGDGVDEHLKASVKELDMPERLIGLCENAGKTKVGHLADILDGKDGDLSEALDCEAKDAKAIAKAVKLYRDKHRKAAMKAEGSEA